MRGVVDDPPRPFVNVLSRIAHNCVRLAYLDAACRFVEGSRAEPHSLELAIPSGLAFCVSSWHQLGTRMCRWATHWQHVPTGILHKYHLNMSAAALRTQGVSCQALFGLLLLGTLMRSLAVWGVVAPTLAAHGRGRKRSHDSAWVGLARRSVIRFRVGPLPLPAGRPMAMYVAGRQAESVTL